MAVHLFPLFMVFSFALALEVANLRRALAAERRAHEMASRQCRMLVDEAARRPSEPCRRPVARRLDAYDVRPVENNTVFRWCTRRGYRVAYGLSPGDALRYLLEIEDEIEADGARTAS